jgi:hypothetical protein
MRQCQVVVTAEYQIRVWCQVGEVSGLQNDPVYLDVLDLGQNFFQVVDHSVKVGLLGALGGVDNCDSVHKVFEIYKGLSTEFR